MPELPEVETMRRGLLGVVGATIQKARATACAYRPIAIHPGAKYFARRAVGRRIEAVDRIGKRVVLRLDSHDSIIFEPRMTGLVLVADPPNREHLRFQLQLSGVAVPDLWFWDRRGLGSVRLVSPEEFLRQLGPEKLGPDALAVSADQLRERLRSSRRPIKPALLDQRIVAGVGNLYASELLHRSGIHPERRCDRLTRDQWRRLHAAMLEVLEEAIRHEGSTLSDGTYRNALNQSGDYQNHHRVYDRAGEKCLDCSRGVILRIVQAQRATFYCPRCQRRAQSDQVD
jgi:formamidopyrimidine-DNA glycosylase